MSFAHLSLRVRIFLFFALMALGGIALVIVALVLGYTRLADPGALSAFIISGVLASLAILGLTAWIWMLFDENVAKPVVRLASELRTRAHADVDRDLDTHSARYLGDLAPAAVAVAGSLASTKSALTEAVQRETARLGREKQRLEMLLRDIPGGVLFCTPEHAVALYNRQAVALLEPQGQLGLNRSIFDLLLRGPIEDAFHRLTTSAQEGATTNLLCIAKGSGQTYQARMRLMRLPGQETAQPGYVLTLEDVTETLAAHAAQEALIDSLLDQVRRPATNLSTLLEALPASRAEPERAALTDALIAESHALSTAVITAARSRDADTPTWWPQADVPDQDLATGLVDRVAREGVALDVATTGAVVHCDGFAMTRLFAHLACTLAQSGAQDMRFEVRAWPDHISLDLTATGPLPTVGTVEGWMNAPLSARVAGFTGNHVLKAHGTALWPEAIDAGRFRLHLPLRHAPDAPQVGSRSATAAFYDFDLLHATLPPEMSDAPIGALSYVVFDTETTGLLPESGDEIVQIAAVRVVNGTLLPEERFDILVNPGRRIPATSTAIHKVTDAMVANALPVPDALRRFHAFAKGAVLVAHNAPFDMAFLRRREAEIGLRFDMPVLDTVLLSAILFGQSETHTLDALTERLALSIPEADRHTAIGDAIGTGAALAKMLPMLEGVGLKTLGQTIKAFDQHKRLIENVN